jgi:antirestriction protein ArdC
VISKTNARIEYGGNLPCYRPSDDLIQLPFRNQFDSSEAYYETAFHELVHWTEKEDRVGRRKGHERAFGELVAEIGACFLMNELELQTANTLPNSIAYVESWLQAMADDTKFIFAASAQASKAVDYILSFSRQPEESQEPEVAIPF